MEETKQQERKKIMLSGIQPTGVFTLGNYLGAVRNWRETQENFQCAYFIADLHSLTIRIEPAKRRYQTLEAFALLMACGLDPERSLLFVQSHVPAHAELSWILSCYSMFGDLSRMTQFKDKASKHTDNVNAGLFTYPALMAADILLYQPDYVPVGEDQRQHLEFTRDVAVRFNGLYGNVFRIPDAYILKAGARIMSLQDPTKKMSKSDPNPHSFVSVLDDPNVIINKFKRAVTDSETCVCYREGKDGINNLMSIYSSITGASYEQIEKDFAGKGYGTFKKAVGDAVVEELRPVREKFTELMNDKAYLQDLCRKGAETASVVAGRTLAKAQKKVGLLPLNFQK